MGGGSRRAFDRLPASRRYPHFAEVSRVFVRVGGFRNGGRTRARLRNVPRRIRRTFHRPGARVCFFAILPCDKIDDDETDDDDGVATMRLAQEEVREREDHTNTRRA